MSRTTSLLKPLSVSPRLHKKTKLAATLDDKQINEMADELFLPVVEQRLRELSSMSKNRGKR